MPVTSGCRDKVLIVILLWTLHIYIDFKNISNFFIKSNYSTQMAESGIHPSKLLIITADQKEEWKEWLESFKSYAVVVQFDKKDAKM